MKSIRTGIIFTSLAVGLLMLAPARIQAQYTTLSITLTATYENPNVTQPNTPATDSGTISATGTKSLKVTPTTIQNLILSNLLATSATIEAGSQAGNALTSLKGYTLIWDQNDSFIGETNSRTGDFQDADGVITINTDASGSGDLVTSGTSDSSDPIGQAVATTSEWNITIDDGNGNTANLYGLIKMTVSLKALTKAQINNVNGAPPQTETISFSGSVSGYGTVFDNDGTPDEAVFSGSISGSGSGPQGD